MTQLKKRTILRAIIALIWIILIAGLVFSTLVIIGLYRSRNRAYPWSENNVIWYSEDPKIEIIKDENHYLDGYLYSDEEKIEIHLVWGPGLSCEIVHKDGYLFEDGSVSDKILLEGEFSYNGEYVTLQVETDKVYDYKYKEIILYKRAVDVEN